MDARGETGMLGDAPEQADELAALRRVERGEDLLVLGVRDGRGRGQQAPRRRGQVDGVGAAVVGVPPPLDEATLLEVVHEPDHRVPVDRHDVRELLLGPAVRGREVGEQAKVTGLEPEGCQSGGEQLGGMEADLGEKERRPLGEGLRHGTDYPIR
jgi:hypothetical protein